MKKIRIILLVSVFILPLMALTHSAQAGNKSTKKLVGNYIKEVQKMRSSKDFAEKRVLLVVNEQKKACTVEALLAGVELALSEPQHSIFVEPLIIAQTQEASFIEVEVGGTYIKNIKISKHPPAEHVGLAALVIQYTGDSTLPVQAMANIQTQ